MVENTVQHQGFEEESLFATAAGRNRYRFRLRWPLLAAVSLWLAACAPLAPEPPVEPQPEAPEAVEAPLPPALLALVDRAAEFSAAGDHDDAAAALERALRLSPEEPGLWHRLAAVRLAQGDWGAAEAMAQRSLDRDERGVWRRANWRLIAEARRQAGDRAGAREAEARLRAG
ncbi:MAG: tetratricopeptide repeat protein [Gammaproteobacteria bacterium]|nr:tetratricopeptide repeat protein [Gammaproteobacteria bacterium]